MLYMKLGGVFHVCTTFSGMTSIRVENICRPQLSTELMAWTENASDWFVRPIYVGVQSSGGRVKTEAELDTWT